MLVPAGMRSESESRLRSMPSRDARARPARRPRQRRRGRNARPRRQFEAGKRVPVRVWAIMRISDSEMHHVRNHTSLAEPVVVGDELDRLAGRTSRGEHDVVGGSERWV